MAKTLEEHTCSGGGINPRTRLDPRDVHLFEAYLRSSVDECRFGRLEKLLVVAVGEVRLVVSAARFVAQPRALNNYPRQLQHVVKLTRKREAGIRPLRLIREI